MKDFLDFAPIFDGLLERHILFLRQGDGDRLGFDFAGPLVTRAAGTGSPVLDVTVAEPAHFG